MSWKIFPLLALLILPMVQAFESFQVPNPDTFTHLTTVGPVTADPAWAYDSASAQLIFNVYQSLMDFEFTYTDRFVGEIAESWPGYGEILGNIISPMPPNPHVYANTSAVDFDNPVGSTWTRKDISYTLIRASDGLIVGEQVYMSPYLFVPAKPEYNYAISEVEVVDDVVTLALSPLFINQTWYFRIRTGVQWQDPAYGTVTPFDVEYSIERGMVEDPEGGPMWTFYEPLTGNSSSRDWDLSDPFQAMDLGIIIDDAVESNATHVWFNLFKPYMPFQQTLCRTWGSILCAKWAIEQGCWNASWHVTPGDYTSWVAYNNPPSPGPIGYKMMGQGPYYLDIINPDPHTGFYVLVKFDNYWGGWTKPHCSTIVHKIVQEWKLGRREAFLSGEADVVTVLDAEENDSLLLAAIADGRVRYMDYLTTPQADAILYCYDFGDPMSPYMHYIGDGMGGWVPNSTLLSDIDMRLALTYCWNSTQFIEEELLGEAAELHNPIVYGVSYCNSTKHKLMHYKKEIASATQCFQNAWNGEIWQKGFKATIVYPIGYTTRQFIAEMIEYVVENEIPWPDTMSGTVDIQPVGLPWAEYLTALSSGQLGWFIHGLSVDLPDPDPWVLGFMYTQKGLGSYQHIRYGRQPMNWHPNGDYGPLPYYNYKGELITEINNTYVDGLIQTAVKIVDPVLREKCYTELMDIYYAECASRMTCQPYGNRHYERTWVHGWFYHPCIYPGLMFYGEMNLWKQDPDTVTRGIAASCWKQSTESWIKYVTVTNFGENPEFVDISEKVWVNGELVSDEYIQVWLESHVTDTVCGQFKKTENIPGIGNITIQITVEISNWVGYIPISYYVTYTMGDLGSGPPLRFFAFDGTVNGFDVTLFIMSYNGLGPPCALYLADLGSGPPPTFFAFDGIINAWDMTLFIMCYNGLGPDP